MLSRARHATALRRLLRANPVVALLGARQVGKSTLARAVAGAWPAPVTWFDLEATADVARLESPAITLGPLKVFVADSGLLHTHLDIETLAQLERHPSLGASWEGFCLEQTLINASSGRPTPAPSSTCSSPLAASGGASSSSAPTRRS